MYGWLLRGKGFSGDAGVISAAAMYTASGLQQDRRALMKVRGRFGPDQWHALQGAPVRTGCPWRYVRHLPSSHDVLAFSVGVVPGSDDVTAP